MLERISKLLRLCGNGKKNNWSVRFADYFFVDCGCCLFWRGVMVGIAMFIVYSMAFGIIWFSFVRGH